MGDRQPPGLAFCSATSVGCAGPMADGGRGWGTVTPGTGGDPSSSSSSGSRDRLATRGCPRSSCARWRDGRS